MSVHPIKPGSESHKSDNQEVKGSLASIISALAKQPFLYLTSSIHRPLSSSNWIWAVNDLGPKTGPILLTTSLSLRAAAQTHNADEKRQDRRRLDQRILDQYVQDFFNNLRETFNSSLT